MCSAEDYELKDDEQCQVVDVQTACRQPVLFTVGVDDDDKGEVVRGLGSGRLLSALVDDRDCLAVSSRENS